ncbi:MAG: hypothetical protein QGG56_02525 [Dehalococcoidia bacterium]|jgi:hypothetical protein|nr:hypothetical protein [Dehalococcoidia bacterium]
MVTQYPVEEALAPVLDKIVVVFTFDSGVLNSFQGPNTQQLTTLKRGKGYWVFAPAASNLSTSGFIGGFAPGWDMKAWVGEDTPVAGVMTEHGSVIYFVLGFDGVKQQWSVYQSPLAATLTELKVGTTYNYFSDTTAGVTLLPIGDTTVSLAQFGSWKWAP